MHDTLLSACVGNWLRINCGKRIVLYPVGLMITRHGDASLGYVTQRLRCKNCGHPPTAVWVQENHMEKSYAGVPAGWVVQLL